jgi:hypothetical protein
MDNKPRPQEAFTLSRHVIAELILSSLTFGRNHPRERDYMDGLTDLDLAENFLGFLDSACEHYGTTDLAAMQKANGPCYVKLVGSR